VAALLLPAFSIAATQKGNSGDPFESLAKVEADARALGRDESEPPSRSRQLRHATPALLKYGHHIQQTTEADVVAEDAAEAAELVASNFAMDNVDVAAMDDVVMPPPMALPGRHPSVEKALDGMSGDLEGLREKQMAAKQVRGELEGTMTDAVHHMNDAMSIKHAMAQKEAQVRRENGKLEMLKYEDGKLEGTHDSLVTSLKRMLGPKMMLAKKRFMKKEAVLHKEHQAAVAWQEKEVQTKKAAMELISQKKASHQSLLEAEEAVAEAKKRERLARMNYERDSTATAEKVQSYRYAETRSKAEAEHANAARNAALAARESMEKIHSVFEAEQQKVDASVGYRKQKLERKIHEVVGARQKSTQELTDLEQTYKDWQQKQRERTAEVIKKGQATAEASELYANGQKQVLESAQAKVVKDAESADDWGGWGNDYPKVQDELDE